MATTDADSCQHTPHGPCTWVVCLLGQRPWSRGKITHWPTFPMSHITMSLVEIDYQGHAQSIFYSHLLKSVNIYIRCELSKVF